MAASVLLNFAVGVDFSLTDPLLCMVRTGARLLSYDRLSVGRFPDAGREQERAGHIWKTIAGLRNLLEDRALSPEDRGERIRIIVLLDFKPWGFLKPETDGEDPTFDAAFPTLKIDYVKSKVEEIFGDGNPLLKRFDYLFVFIDDTSDEMRSSLYRNAAFHGFFDKYSGNDWISYSGKKLDQKRDEVLKAMEDPDANTLLDGQALRAAYQVFLAGQNQVFNQIGSFLKRIGKKEAFTEAAKKRFVIKTVKDFSEEPFDSKLKDLITEICGLGASRFRDCTFFILNLNPAYVAQRSRGTLSLKSLIQLLCSVDDEQFGTLFRPDGPLASQKMFIISDPEDDDIQKQRLLDYARDITTLGSRVEGMKWDPDKEVEYTEYTAPSENAEGSHETQNEKTDEEGNKNEDAFKKASRVPFFFGKKPGDWTWYRTVMSLLEKCLSFEEENERPLVDQLTRMDDNRLNQRTIKTNFGELGTLIKKTVPADIVSTVDYDKYIRDRKDTLSSLGEKSRALAKELVKLGYRSRLLWLMFFASLAFTGCFAFHFFSDMSNDHPLWISAGFLSFCVIATIGAVIAQVIVKGKIHAVYREINALLDVLKMLSKKHLASINQLAKAMNEADALRKTLFEMKSKYNDWNQHNKKMENWLSFTQSITTLLDTLFMDLGIGAPDGDGNGQAELDIKDALLESKPSVVVQIREKYNDMRPILTVVNNTQDITVNHVTCFITQFTTTCIQKSLKN